MNHIDEDLDKQINTLIISMETKFRKELPQDISDMIGAYLFLNLYAYTNNRHTETGTIEALRLLKQYSNLLE